MKTLKKHNWEKRYGSAEDRIPRNKPAGVLCDECNKELNIVSGAIFVGFPRVNVLCKNCKFEGYMYI